jgi:hypothetical protein
MIDVSFTYGGSQHIPITASNKVTNCSCQVDYRRIKLSYERTKKPDKSLFILLSGSFFDRNGTVMLMGLY